MNNIVPKPLVDVFDYLLEHNSFYSHKDVMRAKCPNGNETDYRNAIRQAEMEGLVIHKRLRGHLMYWTSDKWLAHFGNPTINKILRNNPLFKEKFLKNQEVRCRELFKEIMTMLQKATQGTTKEELLKLIEEFKNDPRYNLIPAPIPSTNKKE